MIWVLESKKLCHFRYEIVILLVLSGSRPQSAHLVFGKEYIFLSLSVDSEQRDVLFSHFPNLPFVPINEPPYPYADLAGRRRP